MKTLLLQRKQRGAKHNHNPNDSAALLTADDVEAEGKVEVEVSKEANPPTNLSRTPQQAAPQTSPLSHAIARNVLQ